MAAPNNCPKCGAWNPPGWTFCAKCGSSASGAAGVGGAGLSASERSTQIDRTRIGILILFLGALLSWVPTIGLLGLVFTAIGAILVILGRRAFGRVHERSVIVSILLYFIGGAVAVGGGALALGVGAGAIQNAPNEFALAAALEEAFTNIVLFAAIGAFVSGLGSVFFTYALQTREGQRVLWAAYAATIGVQFATLFLALPVLAVVARSLAAAKFTGTAIDVAGISAAYSAAVATIQWVAIVPALLYALANFIAWSRIDEGEIPA